MRLPIATLVVSALLIGAANAAPPQTPPGHTRAITCEQARPGTKLWLVCHKKKPAKAVKPGARQPKASKKPALSEERRR